MSENGKSIYAVKLSWKYPLDHMLMDFQVYRSKKGSDMRLYKTVSLNKKLYSYYPVNLYLEVEQDVYALGDCAYLVYDEKRIPMLAQVAVKQASIVAYNISYQLGLQSQKKKYRYHLDGFSVR